MNSGFEKEVLQGSACKTFSLPVVPQLFGTIVQMHRKLIVCLLVALLLTACNKSSPEDYPSATSEGYNPFVPLNGNATMVPVVGGTVVIPTVGPVQHTGPTPTLAPFSVRLPATRLPGAPILSPTPDVPHALPTTRTNPDQYVVQGGDTLGTIAQQFGVSLGALMQANGLADPNLLSIGQTLTIPAPSPGDQGPDFKIIPDSELVYGPASAAFDVKEYVQEKDGYLANYYGDVDGNTMSGADIVTRVAQSYSVNPRLLLALLEHQSGWVTKDDPTSVDYPMRLQDAYHQGLYRQLTWSANALNRGYYLWRANAVSTWVLADGSIVPIAPTINAGTAGVQSFFAGLDDTFTWQGDTTAFGLFQTYFFLFGNPFDRAVEPLVPADLRQPALQLPFEPGVIWSFTGGPHGGWDTGSAWAALDFGPPGEVAGCASSDEWVVAAADGLIVRTGDGAVMQDLDGDGFEQTGWVVFYMHIESRDRIATGTYAYTGTKIGHPSCEGGFSNGTHVHFARKYNGEWIAADGPLPFQMEGWISSGDGIEYDGFLTRGDQVVEAWDGRNDLNQIGR